MAIKHYIIALNVDKAIFHVFLWWMPLPQRFLSSKTVLIDQSTSPPLDAIGRSWRKVTKDKHVLLFKQKRTFLLFVLKMIRVNFLKKRELLRRV